jgi:hypothetical protein
LSPVDAEFFHQRNIDVCTVIVARAFGLMEMGAMQAVGISVGFNMQMQTTHLHGEEAEAGK